MKIYGPVFPDVAQGYAYVNSDGSVGSQAVGPQGPQGAQGAQGANGYVGSDGAQGPRGYQGLQGYQGYQGYQGDNASITAPPAPTSIGLTESGDTVQITFSRDTGAAIDTYEVWASQTSSGAGFALIAVVPDADWTNQVSAVVDATYLRKTTTYYRVYAVRKGVRSTALTGNLALTYNAPDVTNVSILASIDSFTLAYTLPVARTYATVSIYKDAQTVQGNLAQGNATLVYSGTAPVFTYTIPDADLGKYHQFWITTVTRT